MSNFIHYKLSSFQGSHSGSANARGFLCVVGDRHVSAALSLVNVGIWLFSWAWVMSFHPSLCLYYFNKCLRFLRYFCEYLLMQCTLTPSIFSFRYSIPACIISLTLGSSKVPIVLQSLFRKSKRVVFWSGVSDLKAFLCFLLLGLGDLFRRNDAIIKHKSMGHNINSVPDNDVFGCETNREYKSNPIIVIREPISNNRSFDI